MTDRYYIIGRGHNGWHASGVNVSISGAHTEQPPVHWRTEGAAVYDASEANADAFTKWVLSGPMVAPALLPGQVNMFSKAQRKRAADMCGAGGLSGGFEAVVAHEAAHRPFEYGSLDQVAVDVYLELLRKHVPGVKFGTIVDGEVVWEQIT